MHSAALLVWLSICAIQDARQRHIANSLTVGVGLVALIWMLWTGHTWLGATAAQGGWALLLALLLTLPGYALGQMGAGDVKLMATIGLASDPVHLLGCFIGAGLASVLWRLLGLRVWSSMSQGLRARVAWMAPGLSKKTPFAPFVLAGLILTLAWIH